MPTNYMKKAKNPLAIFAVCPLMLLGTDLGKRRENLRKSNIILPKETIGFHLLSTSYAPTLMFTGLKRYCIDKCYKRTLNMLGQESNLVEIGQNRSLPISLTRRQVY